MMNRSLRFGTALTALAMAGLLSGCATGQRKQLAASPVVKSKVGMATRAMAAMNAGEFARAVTFAEEAVANSPGHPLTRAVLGHAYFGAGRFASAESAYRDSLTLSPEQPDVILKLALAEIAQGKNAQALGHLEAARDFLEAADYGLALALAGQPTDAVAVLNQAARLPGADARLRQNLALAHALAGDWTMARTIAEQDVPPQQLDARIQDWMKMATPTRASDQVAALTGIRPAADPGQPVHLALDPAPQAPRMAQAPAPQPVAVAVPLPAPVAFAQPEPVEYAEPEPEYVEVPRPSASEVPTVAEAMQAPEAAPEPQAEVAAALMPAVVEAAALLDPLPTRFEDKPPVTKLVAAKLRKPERASGRSNSVVVQLGAYGSPQRVATAWNQLARRYGALNSFTPVSMRFSGPNGTVYRLSVKGFASAGEAQKLCGALQRNGASCFVRRVAGDAPVQLASR
jgi:Flp pilus assembly protein TadD